MPNMEFSQQMNIGLIFLLSCSPQYKDLFLGESLPTQIHQYYVNFIVCVWLEGVCECPKMHHFTIAFFASH